MLHSVWPQADMLGFQRELKNKKTQTERCILGGHWAVRVRAALALKKKNKKYTNRALHTGRTLVSSCANCARSDKKTKKNTQTERCILGGHWAVRVRAARLSAVRGDCGHVWRRVSAGAAFHLRAGIYVDVCMYPYMCRYMCITSISRRRLSSTRRHICRV